MEKEKIKDRIKRIEELGRAQAKRERDIAELCLSDLANRYKYTKTK